MVIGRDSTVSLSKGLCEVVVLSGVIATAHNARKKSKAKAEHQTNRRERMMSGGVYQVCHHQKRCGAHLQAAEHRRDSKPFALAVDCAPQKQSKQNKRTQIKE